MREIIAFIILFYTYNTTAQNKVVINQYYHFNDSTPKKKLQYHFNKKGEIEKSIIFGDHHNRDTTYIGNQTEFKYSDSKIILRVDYTGGDFAESKYIYDGRNLISISHNGDMIKNSYDGHGNILEKMYFEKSDTVCKITYKYCEDKLCEENIYRNDLIHGKVVYANSADTIIQTEINYDSTHVQEPKVIINKKIYKNLNLIYSSWQNKEDNNYGERFISYNVNNELALIEESHIVEKQLKRFKTVFHYDRGIIARVEDFELINDAWQLKNIDIYRLEKPEKVYKQIIIRKVNSYLLNNELF